MLVAREGRTTTGPRWRSGHGGRPAVTWASLSRARAGPPLFFFLSSLWRGRRARPTRVSVRLQFFHPTVCGAAVRWGRAKAARPTCRRAPVSDTGHVTRSRGIGPASGRNRNLLCLLLLLLPSRSRIHTPHRAPGRAPSSRSRSRPRVRLAAFFSSVAVRARARRSAVA